MKRPAMREHGSLRRQRGVAVITALLLTTLAVTIVASLFWRQQVQVRSMENQRLHLQTKWIMRGALDWTRLILPVSAVDNFGMTTPDGIWATPLAETRLDDYVERERVEGEQFDATLSGQVSDAQARYNLANLAVSKIFNPGQIEAFRRLLTNVQLDPGLALLVAQAIADGQPAAATGLDAQGGVLQSGQSGALQAGQSGALQTGQSGALQTAQGGSSDIMEFIRVEDLLSVPGFTPTMVERLRPFVIVLPAPTPVNVNTASAEVLAAIVADFSTSEATALLYGRKSNYFRNEAAFLAQLNGKKLIAGVNVAVKSDYFLIDSRVRLDRAALDAQALVRLEGSIVKLLSIREN
jgi:general secretion pathway protein K